MNRKQHLVFAGACIAILLFGAGITMLGSVKQALMGRFVLDEMGAGTLFSILPLGILFGSLLFGPASDRYGYKYILASCCFSMFLGFEGVVYATSFGLLKLSVFLFGLGGGAINGATSALVSDLSEDGKGANLSVLGVFFGLGALGMPLVLGAFEKVVPYEIIISIIGGLCLLSGLFYLMIGFPPAKLSGGFPIKEVQKLLRDPVLIMIAFFLFCQSSLESIINNWSTSYLIGVKQFAGNLALFALSLSVVGMTVMRLLLGSVLRKCTQDKLWLGAFSLLILGLSLLTWGKDRWIIIGALVLIGAGLAGGFPLMLGMVGQRFKQLSATAFGIVLVLALAGNMLVNYLMGLIVQYAGIHLMTVAILLEWLVMGVLCFCILRKNRLG
ncbi:MFS transporter [Arachidicoccus ginsenosidivorans]|uniref:MFS transporter n=1 Tax=Arachidicoccus ginsenosidivorans TaxID=496057 RepID=A0A5B8VJJ6_9BACT|nr:MFS transporter [Arachidicoccus ginsenosidivorans]QEC71737.1 MFS transporter [Arachidicoccus ginsenosidivorans]